MNANKILKKSAELDTHKYVVLITNTEECHCCFGENVLCETNKLVTYTWRVGDVGVCCECAKLQKN